MLNCLKWLSDPYSVVLMNAIVDKLKRIQQNIKIVYSRDAVILSH